MSQWINNYSGATDHAEERVNVSRSFFYKKKGRIIDASSSLAIPDLDGVMPWTATQHCPERRDKGRTLTLKTSITKDFYY